MVLAFLQSGRATKSFGVLPIIGATYMMQVSMMPRSLRLVATI